MIKSVETVYAGVRFRSRLEARWAVFMDAAGIEWEYECDRIALSGGGTYLPDFKLTVANISTAYAEVKGAEHFLDKPYLIRAAMELGMLIIWGPVPDCRKGTVGWHGLIDETGTGIALLDLWPDLEDGSGVHPIGVSSDPCEWTRAPIIREQRTCGGRCPYDAARSARFEHGQSGAI